MSITIGSVVIDEASLPVWVDEFGRGSDLVGQIQTVSVTGSLVFQASAQQAGRPMTLQGRREGNRVIGAITRAQLTALHALSQVPDATYTVVLHDGREFEARFRRADGPAVEGEDVLDQQPVDSGDWLIPTIRLVLT